MKLTNDGKKLNSGKDIVVIFGEILTTIFPKTHKRNPLIKKNY